MSSLKYRGMSLSIMQLNISSELVMAQADVIITVSLHTQSELCNIHML
jgi:hypothetical protein